MEDFKFQNDSFINPQDLQIQFQNDSFINPMEQPLNPKIEFDPSQLAHDTVNDITRTTPATPEEKGWLEELFLHMFNIDVTTENSDAVNEGLNFTERYHITDATSEWHCQETGFTCAVCSQEFIINEFLDANVTEGQLLDIACEHGWIMPGSGTSIEDVGKLLDYFGIETQTDYNGSFEKLKDTLDSGGRAVVCIDADVLWYGYPAMGANHAVEVIGIDDSDPDNLQVIINDSGVPDGCGKAYPYLQFLEAWSASGNHMVSAHPNT